MAAPADTDAVKKFDKVGGLFKMGVSSDTWQERIFALSKKKKTLYYFRNDDEFKQYVQYQLPSYCAGVIPLFNTSIYVAGYMGPGRQHAFELVTLERNYVMSAPSEEELTEWVLTIASTGVKLKTPNKPTKDTADMPYRRELGRQGYLHKKGDWNPSYRKRFFRTTENAAGNKVMSYYLKLEDAKPRGVITLTGSEIKALETPTTDFTIKDPTRREFFLRAENELDRANWIDVLQSLADGSADTLFKVPNSMKRTTYYTTLDVDPDATQDEISRKYRALSKKHHPDRNPSADAKETFQQLNEAYSVIGDPKRRAEYDNELIAAGILPADFVRDAPKSPSTSGPRLALEAAKDEDAADEEDAARRNSEHFRAGHELKTQTSNASDTVSPKGHKPMAHQVVVGDTQLATEQFLSNPDNFCSHCENKLKALYCCNCEIDFCISCSVQLHQEGVLALHKRLAINKVEDWMQAIQTVGSKEEVEWTKVQEDIKAYLAKNGGQRPSVAEEAVNQAKEKAALRKSLYARPATLPAVSESTSSATPAAQSTPAPAPAAAATAPIVIIPAEPPKAEPAASPAVSESKSKEDEEKDKKKKKKDKKEKKKKEEEEAAKKAAEEAKAHDTVDESRLKSVLSALEVGTSLYKIPRTGDAKLTKVYLKPMGNAYELAWDSHKWIGDSSIPLAGARLVQGQTTPLFKEQKHREQFASQAHLSFSVINDKRSVDLVALNEKEYNQWMQGIQYGIKPRLS